MELPDLLYHKEHSWALIRGGKATIGLTEYAIEALGGAGFIELPSPGEHAQEGDELCRVETAGDEFPVIAPISGIITEVNDALEEEPELLDTSPYALGWIAVIELSDPEEAERLMDGPGYEEMLEKGD